MKQKALALSSIPCAIHGVQDKINHVRGASKSQPIRYHLEQDIHDEEVVLVELHTPRQENAVLLQDVEEWQVL